MVCVQCSGYCIAVCRLNVASERYMYLLYLKCPSLLCGGVQVGAIAVCLVSDGMGRWIGEMVCFLFLLAQDLVCCCSTWNRVNDIFLNFFSLPPRSPPPLPLFRFFCSLPLSFSRSFCLFLCPGSAPAAAAAGVRTHTSRDAGPGWVPIHAFWPGLRQHVSADNCRSKCSLFPPPAHALIQGGSSSSSNDVRSLLGWVEFSLGHVQE